MNKTLLLSAASDTKLRIEKVLGVIRDSLSFPDKYSESELQSLLEIKLMGEGIENNVTLIIDALVQSSDKDEMYQLQYRDAWAAINTSNEFIQSIVSDLTEA